MTTLSEPLRPFGFLEKYQLSKQLVHAYGTITLTVVLRHPPFDKESDLAQIKAHHLSFLYAAVCNVVKKHPMLSVVVADWDKPTAHFKSLSSFDLADIVRVESGPFWQEDILSEAIAVESKFEFDLNALLPLWKFAIVSHNDRPDTSAFIFTLHHVIGDGMSLTIFWKSLLTELASSDASAATSYMIPCPELKSLNPPMEHRNPPQLTLGNKLALVKNLAIEALPKPIGRLFDPSVDVWRGDYRLTNLMHDTRVHLVTMGGDEWKAVRAKAKSLGLSPHSVIMATLLLTWAELYPNKSVNSATPSNCRSVCQPPIPADEIGNFVGSSSYFWTAKQLTMSVWDLAKQYQKQLRSDKYKGIKQVLLLEFLPKYPESYRSFYLDRRDKYPVGRSGDVELSDLGLFATQKEWGVQALWFCQSSQVYTTAVNLNGISTGEAFHGTLSWHRDAIDASKMDLFVPKFLKRLRDAI